MCKVVRVSLKAIFFSTILAALLVGHAVSPVTAQAADAWKPEVSDIKIGGGSQGGSWYIYGGKIAELINAAIPGTHAGVTLGGGTTNIVSCDSGEYQFALNHGVTNWWGWTGGGPFNGKKYQNVRQVISFWPAVSHFIAPRSLGIEWVEQIDDAKRKICWNPLAGATPYWSELSINACGFSTKKLIDDGSQISYTSHTIGAQNMQDGLADIVHLNDPPNSAISMELDKVIPGGIVELKLRPEQLKKVIESSQGFIETKFPGGLYSGNPDPFPTLGSMNTVICNANLSDELVYRVTKVMVENLAQLNAVFPPELQVELGPQLVEGIAIPLHPGAKRYFEEIGLGKYIREPAL